MENKLVMPAAYAVMSQEEMTYTDGGVNAIEALCAWIPIYGWFKGCMAIRDYRESHPATWLDTGLDALSAHMESSAVNLIHDIGCTLNMIGVCGTVVGLIPTALIILV